MERYQDVMRAGIISSFVCAMYCAGCAQGGMKGMAGRPNDEWVVAGQTGGIESKQIR